MPPDHPKEQADTGGGGESAGPAETVGGETEARAAAAYLANMRNELRMPIDSIIGYAEMLLEDAAANGWDDSLAELTTVRESGRELLEALNDVLESEADAGRELDLRQLMDDVNVRFRTPLNSVMGYAELLIEEAEDDGRDVIIPDLRQIRTAGDRLLARLSDIAAYPELQERLRSSQSGDTASMVRRALAAIRPLAPHPRGASLEAGGAVLVVDDNQLNRSLLERQLQRQGHTVTLAENGREGLSALSADDFDVVLLDVLMPGMSGVEVLQQMKRSEALRGLPVIMISALDEMDSVVRCIELGAEDYLHKPFNPVLLEARVAACLRQKRLHDREQTYVGELRAERARAEGLLLNVLPAQIVRRLEGGESTIAEDFPEATILFADIVGFTEMSAQVSPVELVQMLNEIFSAFDRLTERHGLEKIKTIGDAYMVVGGLPTPRPDHAESIAEMALDMLSAIARFARGNRRHVRIRIGINTGPVVAGIIGERKFIYDLWGDSVNTASRMESHGVPNAIQVTEETRRRLEGKYQFRDRGLIDVKGKGRMPAFLLTGRLRAE